jgi:hypothetical protein
MICHFWVLLLYIKISIDLFSSFVGFWPILGDIGPFLRRDLGEKLGGCYPFLVYKNQRFLEP